MLKTVIQDVLFGLRMLRKNPGFTFVAVLTLALGIGANSTVFTLVNTVLFKGLPYHDPDRIVAIASTNLAKNQPQIWVAYPDFQDWRRAQGKAFKGLAAVQLRATNISDPDRPAEQCQSARVCSNPLSHIVKLPGL